MNGPGPGPAEAFDAVVLAGGRSARLGGVPKALLEIAGRTLLERTLDVLDGARRIAVVGPPELAAVLARRPAAEGRLLLTREDPPFAGPAAGIAAGVAALAAPAPAGADDGGQAPLTLLLACDMPGLAGLPQHLLAAVRHHPEAGLWLPVDATGREQQLACCARTSALAAAVAAAGGAAGAGGLSVRKLLAPLAAVHVPLPAAGTTEDIDTWADAARFGIARPAP
ncbi:NTP transferase domain-containing protein [Arthrobacter sp. I2-34]|uniref:NTP transferase domain-containing protein n=1 Tax=Arthrobacter hankyongi TaxID=2904801 RepID=A0ABS9L2X1_9MICC|nr:NTP transferase domain-containing protein [Arthrobacter hankyongi]MCG2621034.1 NTP transferase domain-containing protein [Arthrobacter hankyongi]